MAWCPNCKLEYVKGITVCPDCKSALVESLEEASDQALNEGEDLTGYEGEAFYDSDEAQAQIEAEMAQMEMMARMKKVLETPPYKPKDELLSENKSSAVVLVIFGLAGIVILALNALNIINLPMKGYSLMLVNIVMGFLFAVFFLSGIRSALKVKKLKEEVVKEKADIEKVTEFIKEKKHQGDYVIDKDNYEESYLGVSEQLVKDVEDAFPDLEKGFVFYIVDRYGSDILDED